jgi:hypothetical protein
MDNNKLWWQRFAIGAVFGAGVAAILIVRYWPRNVVRRLNLKTEGICETEAKPDQSKAPEAPEANEANEETDTLSELRMPIPFALEPGTYQPSGLIRTGQFDTFDRLE